MEPMGIPLLLLAVSWAVGMYKLEGLQPTEAAEVYLHSQGFRKTGMITQYFK